MIGPHDKIATTPLAIRCAVLEALRWRDEHERQTREHGYVRPAPSDADIARRVVATVQTERVTVPLLTTQEPADG